MPERVRGAVVTRFPGYTPAQLARIIELAPTTADPQIARDLGFKPGKVLHIRKRNGIVGVRCYRRPPELIEAVRIGYVVKGWSSVEVGRSVGLSGTSVRRITSQFGWHRPRALQIANLAASIRSRPLRPMAPPKPPRPVLGANDAALVAEYLASRPVTLLPPGTAAGLSGWERVLFTAPPPGSSVREQAQRFRVKRDGARQAVAA